ncbi:unnamed protein product, partial [Allacma fusca]
DQELS